MEIQLLSCPASLLLGRFIVQACEAATRDSDCISLFFAQSEGPSVQTAASGVFDVPSSNPDTPGTFKLFRHSTGDLLATVLKAVCELQTSSRVVNRRR